MHHFIRPSITAALAALALAGCNAPSASPAGSAMPHGTTSAPVDCPEQDPAQPNCRVPR